MMDEIGTGTGGNNGQFDPRGGGNPAGDGTGQAPIIFNKDGKPQDASESGADDDTEFSTLESGFRSSAPGSDITPDGSKRGRTPAESVNDSPLAREYQEISAREDAKEEIKQWAKDKVQEQIAAWTQALEEAGLTDFRIVANGSIACGHFSGAKPQTHSLNPKIPDHIDEVIEGDLRLILSNDQNPHDPRILEMVERITGSEIDQDPDASEGGAKEISRWGHTIPIAYFYKYEDLGGGVAWEWELCINKEPYVEIASYWGDAFTPEEVNWQTELRDTLRAAGVDYRQDFLPMKNLQTSECRWRMIAAYALAHFLEHGEGSMADMYRSYQIDLPEAFKQEPHEMLKPMIHAFLAGDTDSFTSLMRPESQVSRGVDANLEKIGEEELAQNMPIAPEWVRFAESLQHHVADKRNRR